MSAMEGIALVSACTAIVALLLTVANFGVARANLALALFDRRMAVYQEVRNASSLVMVSDQEFVEKDGLRHLHKAVNEGRFLFGPEVVRHLDSLWKAGVHLVTARDSADRRKTGAYHNATAALVDGTVELQKLLSPYMSMNHKLPPRFIRKFFG